MKGIEAARQPTRYSGLLIKNVSSGELIYSFNPDTAGTIKRFIENMMPKATEVIELGVPTLEQNNNWFRTWNKRLPQKGMITFFDRSWYSRAVIQPAMEYCSKEQYKYFMKKVNKWEKNLIDKELILIKFYLSISKENQEFRAHREGATG